MTVKVLICGGGNGAHVMAGIAAGEPGVTANVLTLYADEAERWTKAMQGSDFSVLCHNPDGTTKTIKAKPSVVTKDAAVAMDGVNVLVFVVPAFAHAQYLKELEPHVKPGLVFAGLPGQAGFEFAVRGAWKEKAKHVTLLSFESLPWACRIMEFGKSVEVLGTKGSMTGAGIPGATPPPEDAVSMVQRCLGPFPVLQSTGHLLGVTMMGVNGYLHPSIMYGKWSTWDGKPFDEKPLFYNGLDRPSANLLSAVSDEVVATAKSIMQQRPQVDLNNVTHIYQWYLSVYSDDISDKTDIYSVIQTNKAYKGLTHPMEKTSDGKWMPDFKYRYMLEDIPCGLVVTRGIAAIAGVPTPNIDKIIYWAQGVMGKEYLVHGKMTGKDIGETRAPQKFGLTTLDAVLGLD